MRYLLTRGLTEQELIIHTPPRPIEYKPGEEKELLERIKSMEKYNIKYKIEVCYTIDKSEIVAPS